MCDDFAATAHEAALASCGITRRQFAAFASAAALAGCARAGADAGARLAERMVSITTADGIADAFFVHPDKGRHPGVIIWPDIAGLREVKKIMARSLAAANFAVLVVNPYYRHAPAPVMESFSDFLIEENRARMMAWRETLVADAVRRDALAFIAFLDRSRAVDRRRGIGVAGYCMGGPFAVRTAAAVPGRVRAAASFHGSGLVTTEPDSPHRLLKDTQAACLFAIARNDDARAPADKDALRRAAEAAGRPAEIEVYHADHGWCVPDSPAWDPSEADRAWQRLVALFNRL
ncbi:MAG: dienelactone hydrolase family protein [Novosphingobium sp.]|nr:dienelactone hydrolase family protein [Novosphingobium sp.]